MNLKVNVIGAVIFTLGGNAAAFAQEPVDYATEVKPILKERCYACHGALQQESGLRLDTGRLIRQGGDSGAAVTPREPAESLLIERVSAEDEFERMPPEGEPLSAAQIETLTRWIAQGAASPDDEQPQADPREHWAFRQPQRPSVPIAAVARDAPAGPEAERADENAIDAFIAAKLAQQGLTPQPAAPKHVVLRRVYLDLIGLPPTREELLAFLSDDSPDAYARVVEGLFNSPHYGERWGRHWMDVWRYSDWYGRRHVPDVWNSAPQIWRWRDWIVRSLNEDKGYDQMLREMLAADEICPEDAEAAVATGYLIRNWYALNPNDWMRNTLEHTGKAFLGLTFNCAHCHDHKYDPITQDDYFRLRAFFEPIYVRQDRVPGEADPGPFEDYQYSVLRTIQRLGAVRVFDKTPDAPTWFYTGGDERNRVTERGSIPPGVPEFLAEGAPEVEPIALPPRAWYPGLNPGIQETVHGDARRAIDAAEAELAAAQSAGFEVPQAARDQLAKAEAAYAAALEGAVASSSTAAPSTSVTTKPIDESALAELKQELEAARRAVQAPALRLQAAETSVAAARAELVSVDARIAADRAKYGETPEADATALAREASRLERQAVLRKAEADVLKQEHAHAVAESKPADDEKRAAEIKSAAEQLAKAREASEQAQTTAADTESETYAALSPQYPHTSTGRRRALAEWITARDNPLTARVAVNHIWMRHFHAPLVSSVYDFGIAGGLPTHPELLDWLAVELMESGWSMRHVHRLIVTSKSYQRTSAVAESSPAAEIDPENKLLSRMNTGRMEAEVVRDSLLSVADRLDLRIGGQELENEQALTTYRRSLYYAIFPEEGGKSEIGELFDAPNALECYRRTRSVVPQQALALTNSELVHQLSADIVSRWCGGSTGTLASDDERFVEEMFERILARTPTDAERELCRESLQKHFELLSEISSEQAVERARESLVRVLLNHNDFVTIR